MVKQKTVINTSLAKLITWILSNLMFCQIFLSPQVGRGAVITNKRGI